MKLRSLATLTLLLAAARLAGDGASSEKHTGWLGCSSCSTGRIERSAGDQGEHPRPPNRDCAQKCIREGSPVVFYDEATKALYRVDNPAATEGQESHKVEIAGTIDAKARTIHVASLKVLEPYVAKCSVGPAK
jgi:hypothetical protein